jgi:glycosyltransferase involved in cell wall biosynthesis
MTTRYLDVSDVVEYFSYNMTASGIQRVQLEFIRYFTQIGDTATQFVIEDAGSFGFVVVDGGLLMMLVMAVDRGSLTREAMTAHLMKIRASSGRAIPRPGDVFFVSGAFWASSSTLRSLWNAKEKGAQVGFLCYDLIPIRNAEFCDANLSAAFRASFETVCQVVDFIFTISVHVKHDVERLLQSIGLDLPVIALPLAHELAPARGGSVISAKVSKLFDRPYVLFVSTIEARKNHAYALTVWQRLLERGVPDVPDMVWVGRPGWLVNDLMERLDRLDYLDGRLKILNRLSDAELAALYQNCWFTVYPSLTEGWGLPVAESLVFGKPAVVSRTTSLPEVGGDFVWYVDPDNITEGVDLIEGLLRDPAKIETAARRISTSFKPRLWSDVCKDLLTGLETLAGQGGGRRALPTVILAPGEHYPAGGNAVAGNLDWTARERAALEAIFDDGWYAAESWGRWMKGVAGGMTLHTPHDAGNEQYLVLLTFNVAVTWLGRSFSLHCLESGEEAMIPARPARKSQALISIRLPPGPATLIIRADRDDAISGADPRRISLGLVAFGFARADDASEVQRLMEHTKPEADSKPARKAGGDEDDDADETADTALRPDSRDRPTHARSLQVGTKSRLQSKSVFMESSWHMRLVQRARNEGLRPTVVRTLQRLARIIER